MVRIISIALDERTHVECERPAFVDGFLFQPSRMRTDVGVRVMAQAYVRGDEGDYGVSGQGGGASWECNRSGFPDFPDLKRPFSLTEKPSLHPLAIRQFLHGVVTAAS